MEIISKYDMIDEINEKLQDLPHKYVRLVHIFVRGLSRNDDEPQNVQEGGTGNNEH